MRRNAATVSMPTAECRRFSRPPHRPFRPVSRRIRAVSPPGIPKVQPQTSIGNPKPNEFVDVLIGAILFIRKIAARCVRIELSNLQSPDGVFSKPTGFHVPSPCMRSIDVGIRSNCNSGSMSPSISSAFRTTILSPSCVDPETQVTGPTP